MVVVLISHVLALRVICFWLVCMIMALFKCEISFINAVLMALRRTSCGGWCVSYWSAQSLDAELL